MPLNHDIYHHIVQFVRRADLHSICLVSRQAHVDVTRLLYRDVCIGTLPALVSFRETVVAHIRLARMVHNFTDAVSSWKPDQDGVAQAEWPLYMETLIDILNSLSQLRRLALSVSLDFDDLPNYLPRLHASFAGFSHLHALWLMDVTIDALPLIDACPGQLVTLAVTPSHLELAGESHHRPPRPAWKRRLSSLVERHAPSLRLFHCDYSWHLPHITPHLEFPHVAAILPLSGCRVDMALAAAYPALTHLRLGSFEPEISHLDKVWPHLRHLDLEMWDAGTLSPGHRVRNIAFHALLHNQRARAVAHIALLASPHVAGLRISWEWRPDTIELLVDVVALFPNLEYLSIPAFFDYDTLEGVNSFTRVVACLPPSLRVLELRLMMVTQQHLDTSCASRDAMIELMMTHAPQLHIVGIEWMGINVCQRNTYHWRIDAANDTDTMLDQDVAKELLCDYVYSYDWPELAVKLILHRYSTYVA